MIEQDREKTQQLQRQLLLHLRTLQNAGVDWLPLPGPGSPSLAESAEIAAPESTAENTLASPQDAVVPSLSLLDLIQADRESKMSLDERRTALAALAEEVKKCTRCAELCSVRRQTVFGQGEPGVEVCFIGEAPGEEEDIQGLPFVGPAGQMLNRILAACGLKREEVYICNIVKCHPPRNRTPLSNEAANCRVFLKRQLELVQPKFLVALGGCAATNLLGTSLSLGKLRGRFHDYRGIPVMVTYHPSYLLPHRDPSKKREVWEDMQMLLKRMGREVPQRGNST